MKRSIILSVCSLLAIGASAQTVKPHDETAWDYIMMKHGKLIEVEHDHRIPVKANITLVNLSTIHPNGVINVSSGRTKRLKEGQYITMDGRIRYLKDTVFVKNGPSR
jgi:hypothetical protein